MSHVPTLLKSDRLVFEKYFPAETMCMYSEILCEYDQEIPHSHDTARKSHTTIAKHREDKLSKAISYLFQDFLRMGPLAWASK